MEKNFIDAKRIRIENLRLKLINEEKELEILEEKSKPVFSERMLNFRKDQDEAIFNKFKNPKYSVYKKQIFEELKKKYLHARMQAKNANEAKSKAENRIELFERFIAELSEEEKIEFYKI
jgi:hypothetical protein